MGRLYAIALNTFREAIRNRVLYAITVLVVGALFLSIGLGELSLHEEARVARDVSLTAVSFFGSVTAILLGVTLLYREVQKRTIHTIISKPLYRYEFVLGKYLGMVITLTVLVVLFSIGMFFILYLQGVAVTSAILKALLLAYTEVLIVAGVAVFFSSFSSPFLSGVFTGGIFLLGRSTEEMRAIFETTQSDLIRNALRAALRILPDLHLYSVSGASVKGEHVSVHTEFVTWGYVGTAVGYGALYLTILLVLAILIFSRRDFA